MQCLKQFSADELVRVDIDSLLYLSPFGPTVNHRGVLPAPLRTLLQQHTVGGGASSVGCGGGDDEFGNVALLLGVLRDEGYGHMTLSDMRSGVSDSRLQQILRTYIQNTFSYHQQKIYDILLHNYNGWDRPRARDAERDDVMELLGDGQTVAPSIELAQYHARCATAPTYFYSFDRPPKSTGFWDGVAGSWTGLNGGEGYSDDLAFVFGAPLGEWIDPFPTNFTDADRTLSAMVLTYWTNFIKTG